MEKIYADLTVVGAGLSGICAAIAAARHGLKVSLINDRPVLGGNVSSEIGITIGGAAGGGKGDSASIYARESGIIEEIKLTLQKYGSSRALIDAALMDLIYREENISVFLNTLVYDVTMENDMIKAVMGIQLGSERYFEFVSPLFVDSSGDGAVGSKAGAEFRMGRESRDESGESFAPEVPDNYTMGDCLVFHSRDTGKKVIYEKPAFAYDFAKMDFFKNIRKKGLFRDFYRVGNTFHTLWWVEYGGQLNTIRDNEKISLELRKLIYGLWDYIKNSGDFEDVDNLDLEFVSPVVGKRESRRFIGDYVLTQNDIQNKTDFPDAVAIGGWPMDVHAPKGIYDDDPASNFYYVPGIYNIPFRCLYSRNINNLMLAGRDISVTHIALGSTRIVSTCACTGQAVGTAGYLCKKYNVLPQQLLEPIYMDELTRALQRDDQTIMGKKEALNDSPTSNCRITASSTRNYTNENEDGLLQLDRSICLALPLITEKMDTVEIKVRNTSKLNQNLQLEIFGGDRPENYVPTYKIKDLSLEIPPLYDGWLTLSVQSERSKDGKLYFMFGRNEYLGLYYTNTKLTGAVSFENKEGLIFIGRKHVHPNRLEENICFRNIQPSQSIYNVENVLNGYSRPYGLPNLWISENMKQDTEPWIEMDFDVPQTMEEVHIIFNSTLETDGIYGTPQLIRRYTIEITDMNGRKENISVSNNYQRLNRHSVNLDNIKKMRFDFK